VAAAYPRRVPPERLTIAQVTPYPWEQHHEVNRFVERLSDELCTRGHRVVVVAPSDSRELIRESREKIGRLEEDPESVFAEEGCAAVLGVGQSLPFPPTRRSAAVAFPVDVSRSMEELAARAPFDFMHVHEPFAPSAASVALRHSHALNVGTFHAATERLLSTQVARRVVELFFGRLDGRTASFRATADVMCRYFPGDYRVIGPGADVAEHPGRADDDVVDILYSAEEERGALRLFLRALRRLPASLPWRATVWSRLATAEPAIRLPRSVRDRVHFAGPADGSEAQHLARAHLTVAASSGVAPAPQLVLRALAGGAVPVAARLPAYEEALGDGELGLLFEPGDADTLAGQLERLIAEPALRERLHDRVADDRGALDWARVAIRFEDLYREIAARRHDPDPRPAVRARVAKRELIDVDIHMHTNHSHDCAVPVEALLETAEAVNLGAIAITDHNEISGALEARERVERDGRRVKVIVAEEVKTADQGEVIGLFLEEKIERGMSLDDTINEIRRQGGLVYVPHPFDRMHSVPDYEHMLGVVDRVDAIEVFNARVAFAAFNEEAARFAAKYRVVAGAGSDSHVLQGLGSVRIRMRDFEGPEEFIESLRDADIVHKRQRLLYVQALKFMQTKRGRPVRVPASARRAAGRAGDKDDGGMALAEEAAPDARRDRSGGAGASKE
jgi:predicted metal-dependent phosphoesterase TrpH/glycosyltransferase involved in cell wall biosynthesis